MSKPLRILIIEDSEDDALLLLRELTQGGYNPDFVRVETAEAVRASLAVREWDLIISDFIMPNFSGLAALDLVREHELDIPFIIVSGKIGEDVAVEAMKAGAHDYIIKGNLARLVPAIDRELREAEVRRERRLADEKLRQYHEDLEYKVEERTAELRKINELLQVEIAERGKMEELIRHQAYHDPLTALPNRTLFMDHLNLAMTQARRNRTMLVVMFFDLDRFKHVNDSLGHAAGDQLLKDVARRMKTCMRESDTVARIGGDEFTMLLSEISDARHAAGIAEKILAAFHKPYVIQGHEIRITLSIGISTYPDDSEHPDTLIKYADMAMYHAKQQGRNNYQFYKAARDGNFERVAMESKLRQTLDLRELIVHYQPQITAETRQIVCAEALVRWEHPILGLLHPMQFIPLAEETGFIAPLDEWVLLTACAQNRAWQDAGHAPLPITVNLSAGQFQRQNLVETVSRVLHETGLEPEFLELEVTERTAMQDLEWMIPNLTRLTTMGVRFSIDDFGTGYSSLSYLKKLPVQKLKIDRSLVSGLLKKPDDFKAIISAMIAMAHALSLKIVAEGVETEDQRAFLCSAGCDALQGHLFQRPMEAKHFEALIAVQE